MRINRFEIVTSFELDQSIVFTCGTALKHLQTELGGQLVSINTPAGASPSLPRTILKLGDTILNVSLDRFQITTQPPSHVAHDFDSATHFARQRTSSFSKKLFECMPIYKWSGMIIYIDFPEKPLTSNSRAEASIPLFDRLIQIDRLDRDLTSFQLNFGIKEDVHYITYTIKAYEEREVAAHLPSQAIIDFSKLPLAECGIQVKVDVNNKSEHTNKGALEDIEILFQKQKVIFDKLPEELNLKEILT